ncbi:MAG: hypothetical protein ACYCUM_11125 [Solirubrobacteraceae bacterium]
MPPASDGPAFPVIVDEETLAEDLAHASESARAAIEPMVARLADSGAPARWLKRCEEEARDGTSLPGCVKMYIPQPDGQWGAVFLGTTVNGTLTLILLAVGERHPTVTWRPSVYQVADRRLNS